MVVRELFRILGAVRGRRPFHPHGIAFEAAFEPSGDARASAFAEPHAAVVRFSRGAGLPEPAPDFLGIAVRLLDAHGEARHQDVLTTSCWPGPRGKLVLRPARSFLGATYTTLFPYDARGDRVLLGARTQAGEHGALSELARSQGLRFELLIARPTEPWRRLGSVSVGRRLTPAESERVRFDPWNCGEDLQPSGPLNRLRRPAYVGARHGAPHAH